MSLLLLFQTAAAGGAYNINAEPATLTLSGVANTFRRTRVMNAVAATYTQTGSAATTVKTKTLALNTNSFTQVGILAILTKTKNISSLPTSYSVGGVPASTVKARNIHAAAGVYNKTGATATFLRTFSINANNTTYNLTGYNDSGIAFRNLPAFTESYALTGSATTFRKDKNVYAMPSSYIVGGISASFSQTYALNSGNGSYSLSGQAATLADARNLIAAYGIYSYSGVSAALSKSASAADAGSYSVDGAYTSVDRTFSIGAYAGSIIITGFNASFEAPISPMAAGSYTYTEFSADLRKGRTLIARADSVNEWDSFTRASFNFNTGIVDSKGHGVTVAGNAAVTTAIVKYGIRSLYLDGTGDYVRISHADMNCNLDQDFTIEMWVYPTVVNNASNSYTAIALGDNFAIYAIAGNWQTNIQGTNTAHGAATANTWTHLAASRVGNTVKIYINGTRVFTRAAWNSAFNKSNLVIGTAYAAMDTTSSAKFIGYIDDVRFLVGKGLYTSDTSIRPPQQMSDTVGIRVLGWPSGWTKKPDLIAEPGSYAIVGNNSYYYRGKTLHANNIDPYFSSVKFLAHLNNNLTDFFGSTSSGPSNAAFATPGFGGYHLNVTTGSTGNNFSWTGTLANFYVGSGNFTFEFRFLWPNGITGQYTFFLMGTTTASWTVFVNGANPYRILYYDYVTAATAISPPISTGVWNHCAIVRNSGTITIYINGSSTGGTTASTGSTVQTTPNPIRLANARTGYPNMTGFKYDEIRYTHAARYTSNFNTPVLEYPESASVFYTSTGSPATLTRLRGIGADPGIFNILGSEVEFGGFRYPAEGSFSVTGYPVNMARDVGATVNCNFNNFIHTGSEPTLAKHYAVNAAAGIVSLSGQDITVRRTRVFSIETGAISYSGIQAEFIRTRLGDVLPGYYSITGFAAEWNRSYVLDYVATSYDLIGSANNMNIGFEVRAYSTSFTTTGSDFTVYRDYVPITQLGNYNVTGYRIRLVRSTRYPAEDYVLHDIIYGDAAQYMGSMDMIYDIETGRFVKLLSKDVGMLV